MELERRSTKPKAVSSSLAKASKLYFGVVQPAGRSSLERETKVQILSPKPNFFISGRSADDYTDLPWEQVLAGLNTAAQTNFIFLHAGARSANGKVLIIKKADASSNLTNLSRETSRRCIEVFRFLA